MKQLKKVNLLEVNYRFKVKAERSLQIQQRMTNKSKIVAKKIVF